MDERLQRILDELPPEEPRSRLEAYGELILQLRRRGCTYRRIVQILADKCRVAVAVSTLHEFVQTRSRKPRVDQGPQLTATPAPFSSPAAEAARQRARALRDEPGATEERPPRFAYDPEEPLSLDQPKEK